MKIFWMILLISASIWIISGIIGGALFEISDYAKNHGISKKNWDYWVACMLLGIIPLKEVISIRIIDKKIKNFKNQ